MNKLSKILPFAATCLTLSCTPAEAARLSEHVRLQVSETVLLKESAISTRQTTDVPIGRGKPPRDKDTTQQLPDMVAIIQEPEHEKKLRYILRDEGNDPKNINF